MEQNVQRQQFIDAYEQYADPIFRYCYLRVYSRESAQDIMQQTFVNVWKYLAGGGEIQNYKPFLYRTATNLIIDESRKHKTVSLEHVQEKGLDIRLNIMIDIQEKLLERIKAKEALAMLSELDPKYREILMMYYVEDFSVREIAEMMERPESTIYVMLHRGIKKLRRLYTKEAQRP